ncbi:class I SAM-dependent methyltransferase [Streptomyces sp. NPDC048441]|uniref:class I SAM-dependent methyltransferase n=1 Tax=Streptomyces sp. NPDC048441 TaxID=3365552 RepID=UPI00371439C9
MPLATLDELRPLLVCPRCRSSVAVGTGGSHCTLSSCHYHRPGAFPVVGRWPVLVDFERSVLRREELVTAADRTGGAELRGDVPRAAVDRLPPRVRGLWKPLNRVAVRNVQRLLRLLPGPAPTLLVVGGGTVGNGVAAVYDDPRVTVIGFDITGSPVTQFVADAHRIPLADGSVDAVLVQAVLEHVLDPWQVVSEMHRVLKGRGLVYAETPFLQQVHAGAYDFVRFTASGHRYLFRRFDELAAGPVTGPGTQLLWSVDHLVRGVTRSALAGRLVRGVLFGLRYLDAVVPGRFAMDSAGACYFLGRKREGGMSPQEIIRYYRGAQRSDGT